MTFTDAAGRVVGAALTAWLYTDGSLVLHHSTTHVTLGSPCFSLAGEMTFTLLHADGSVVPGATTLHVAVDRSEISGGQVVDLWGGLFVIVKAEFWMA